MNAPDPAHRANYYRQVALSRGVPLQFIEDAVVAISEAVEKRGETIPSHWKRTAMLAAIDQVRFWRGHTRGGRAARPEVESLDELLSEDRLRSHAAGHYKRLLPLNDAPDNAWPIVDTNDPPDPFAPMDEQDKRRATHEVLRILSIREHAVLELRLAGWRHHEVAELFGISESRAASIEKQGIKRLRKALG